MRKLIRQSCWETNSSSSHSIAMASATQQFILDTIYPDQFGRIYVNGGEFGWNWDKYNDAQTKLDYAYQDYVDVEMLERVIKEQTGATEVIFDKVSLESGSIDHQSSGTAREVCIDDVRTRDFIFNKNSWLFTGNDNSQADPTFYHVPEIRDGKIINPVFKYELSIEDLDQTTKFLTYPTDDELSNGVDALLNDKLMTDYGGFVDDGDIYFQISRPRDLFEKSYHVRQDYSKNVIIMTREGHWIYDIENKLEEQQPGFKKLSWYKRQDVLTEAILEDKKNCKVIKFTLTEI
jgi:hypothetical protein